MPLELIPPPADSSLIIRADFPGELDADEILKRSATLCMTLLESIPCRRLCLESGYDESSLRDRGDPESALHRLRIELYPLSSDDCSTLPESPEGQILRILNAIPGLSRIRIETERSSFAQLLAPDREILFLSAGSRDELKGYGLPATLEREYPATSPLLYFQEDRDSLDASGVDRTEMIRELQILLKGVPAGELPSEEQALTVIVRGEEELRRDRQALARTLMTSGESTVALGSLGRFRLSEEEALLFRRNRRPCLRFLSKEPYSEGYEISPGVSLEKNASTAEDAAALPGLILLSLLLLYLILGMQTGSFTDALILMICPPLALGGALTTLALSTPSLSLYAFMGLLILQGTAVNSGILLVDAFKAEGDDYNTAHLHRAALKRLRPVLATTLTTAAALLPVILTGIIRGDRQADTAMAVTGGLLTAVPLIMILLPPLYERIHGLKHEPLHESHKTKA